MKNIDEMRNLASECLNCKHPMCKTGCPISTNIPEFIQCIKNNEMEDAYKILQNNNIMSGICGKICPKENQCEGKCVKGLKGQAVEINRLENFVNEWAKENNFIIETKKQEKNNEKIAIIGAGPAGITCAVELAKKGYDVTIFEKEKNIGGILEYEIPEFRLPKKNIKYIKEILKELGITIQENTEFGKDINLQSLTDNKFGAVFLAVGAYVSTTYKLTNQKNSSNEYTAKDILRKYHDNQEIKKLEKTIIIGGGNVAIDVARCINKVEHGKATVVYRRNRELMPAINLEVEEAINEGVKFLYNTKVIEVAYDNNKLKKVRCIKTKMKNNNLEDIENSSFEIEADSIVFAIGLEIDKKLFEEIGIKVQEGLIETDENSMTNIPGVFAGGDLVVKKPTVCKAIATGKKAAERYR